MHRWSLAAWIMYVRTDVKCLKDRLRKRRTYTQRRRPYSNSQRRAAAAAIKSWADKQRFACERRFGAAVNRRSRRQEDRSGTGPPTTLNGVVAARPAQARQWRAGHCNSINSSTAMNCSPAIVIIIISSRATVAVSVTLSSYCDRLPADVHAVVVCRLRQHIYCS